MLNNSLEGSDYVVARKGGGVEEHKGRLLIRVK
jgi:hypothetical protein